MPAYFEPKKSALGHRGGRSKPVWARGRAGRFWGGLIDYARTAWWGLVRPRLNEKQPLEISQAVIFDSSRTPHVLLSIRSDLFGWELPGGTIELGENPEEALLCEVLEETGFDVAIEAHVGDWVREGFRPHIAHVYRCRIVGGTLTPSDETPRLDWFEAAKPPPGLFPWYRAPLDAALRGDVAGENHEWQGIGSILRAMRIDLALRWHGLPNTLAPPGPPDR